MAQSAANHPDMNDPNAFVLYRYHPSLPAATVFIVLFTIATALHILQAAKYRSKFFIPFIVGCFFECGGYVGRALAHNNEYNLNIYIVQTLLLLVAPALFAASIYMVLGRLILLTNGEAFAPIRARWLTKIFVCGDILSFVVQSGGGGLMANIKTMTFGKHLVVVGLLLQIIFFGIFIITSGIFHFRIARSPTPASVSSKWKPCMYTLYAASVFILIRSVFRVIEFSGGNDGVLLRNEVFLYIFDALLMSGVVMAFNAVHPGMVIGRKATSSSIRMTEGNGFEERMDFERKSGADSTETFNGSII